MKKIKYLLPFIAMFILTINVYAHSGRTDANGGHYEKSTNTYHYHNGSSATKSSGHDEHDIKSEHEIKLDTLFGNYDNARQSLKNGFNIDTSEYLPNGQFTDDEIEKNLLNKIKHCEKIFTQRSEQIKATEFITVYIDGLNMNIPTYIKDGVTYIEIHGLFDALDYKIHWNDVKKEVSLNKGNEVFKIYIGSSSAYINDEPISLSSTPEITNGRTFVPIKIVREGLKMDVFWDAVHKAVLVETSLS